VRKLLQAAKNGLQLILTESDFPSSTIIEVDEAEVAFGDIDVGGTISVSTTFFSAGINSGTSFFISGDHLGDKLSDELNNRRSNRLDNGLSPLLASVGPAAGGVLRVVLLLAFGDRADHGVVACGVLRGMRGLY